MLSASYSVTFSLYQRLGPSHQENAASVIYALRFSFDVIELIYQDIEKNNIKQL